MSSPLYNQIMRIAITLGSVFIIILIMIGLMTIQEDYYFIKKGGMIIIKPPTSAEFSGTVEDTQVVTVLNEVGQIITTYRIVIRYYPRWADPSDLTVLTNIYVGREDFKMYKKGDRIYVRIEDGKSR